MAAAKEAKLPCSGVSADSLRTSAIVLPHSLFSPTAVTNTLPLPSVTCRSPHRFKILQAIFQATIIKETIASVQDRHSMVDVVIGIILITRFYFVEIRVKSAGAGGSACNRQLPKQQQES